jgi:hypothetical protein
MEGTAKHYIIGTSLKDSQPLLAHALLTHKSSPHSTNNTAVIPGGSDYVS